MPNVRITNFGEGGLNTDQLESGLQPGQWDRLSNVDVRSSFIAASPGNLMLDHDQCPIDGHYMFIFEQATTSYLVISDGVDVYLWDGATYTQIATGWSSGRVTYTVFLGTLIVNSASDGPFYWDGLIGNDLVTLPGWVTGYRCIKMIAYGNYLFAIRQYRPEDDAEMYRVAWSDTAGIGQIPNIWVPAPENNAGSRVLADTTGHLYNAVLLRDELIIYKGDSAYRCIPRNDNLVFDINRIKARIGSDVYEGVTEYGGQHLILTRGDLVLFDGQNTTSIAVGRVRETLFEILNKSDWQSSRCITLYPRSEVWIMLKDTGAIDYTLLLKFDMEFKSFSIKQLITRDPLMPNGVVGVTGWAVGALDAEAYEQQWNYDGGGDDDTWGNGPKINWNSTQFNPSRDDVVFGARFWVPGATVDDADVVDHREIYRTVNGTYTDQYDQPVYSVAQKSEIVISTLDSNVILKRIYPELDGNTTVGITLGTKNKISEAINWGPTKPFRVGLDRAVNVRGIGQPLAIKIESPILGYEEDAYTQQTTPEDRYWRLNALNFEIQPAGSGRV